MIRAVSIVRCAEYAGGLLDKAIAEAVELAGDIDVKGKTVLVKPNLLNAVEPSRAVTTHPEVLRAFLRLLKSKGAERILVGDSPGWQPQDFAGKRSGLRDATEAEGARWSDFSEGAEFACPEGRRSKKFTLAKVLAEADFLVSLPKLKTHGLMHYTGAIKNLFGLVPGFAKGQFHLRFPAPADFGSMLVDLALAAKPDFCLMDAVVAMEGRGPNSGKPKQLGLILASHDPLALDWSAARLIGYHPSRIPYLADALSRGAWISSPNEIELRGADFEAVRPSSFELVGATHGPDFLKNRMPAFLHRLVKNLSVARPVFDRATCQRCGACVKICPPAALSLIEGADGLERISVDYEKCIRCYCCDEVCPVDAIRLVKRPF